MNRTEIEEINKRTTQEYFLMLDEMATSNASVLTEGTNENDYFYLKINEISKRWLVDEEPIWKLMQDLFVGIYSTNCPFSYLLVSDGNRISLYVGTVLDYIETLSNMLKGIFPQIRYETAEGTGIKIFSYADSVNSAKNCGFNGYIKGNPTGRDSFKNTFQIDSVIKGMKGKPFVLSIFAQPVKKAETLKRQQYWMTKASNCSIFSQLTYSDTDNIETTTYKKNYFHSEQLTKKIEEFCERLAEAISSGEWCTTFNFFSDTEDNGKLLAGLLTSAFYGDDSEPEPVHAIYNTFASDKPIVDGMKYNHSSYCQLTYPKYSTLLSSRELSIYSALPTIDTYGIAVSDFVEFDVDRCSEGDLSIGNILDSGEITSNTYNIDSNEFNRHCLVVGLTGSGKTNTVKSLICGLTKGKNLPFMVIEPAKKEYWELYKLGYPNLQVYSVGSSESNAHTFCINPFERPVCTQPDGKKLSVPIQTHIDFVYAAFKASFIMYTPMPYVLEKAIYSIYEDCGWDIHNNINIRGEEIYPTIEDLYFKIPKVVTAMGYDAKMRNDLIGSLQARINSMRIGSKGDTLNVYRSFSMEKLLQGNVVVELEDIGDDDIKAFIISLLLVNLLEYRRQQEDSQLEVKHLMLIEEAHRLLKNVQSGTGENADPRGAAVEFFCNLLAELRSKGQGFIIADQIPTKLAPDLIKNTNLKITHRTVDEEERRVIGGAMHMTDEQIDALASLKQGVAAVYSEGDNRPKLVKPPYAGKYTNNDLKYYSRTDVLSRCANNCISLENNPEYKSLTDTKPKLCRLCNSHCQKRYKDILSDITSIEAFKQKARWFDPSRVSTTVKSLDNLITDFMGNYLSRSVAKDDEICLLGCFLDEWDISEKLKDEIITKMIKYKGES